MSDIYIRRLFTPFGLSLTYFTQDIQVAIKSFCAKTLKLTIMWWAIVLRGLINSSLP
jgi:hypothetical protein